MLAERKIYSEVMLGRLLFSKDAGKKCTELMTSCAGGTIIARLMSCTGDFIQTLILLKETFLDLWADKTLVATGLDGLAFLAIMICIGRC